MTVEQMRAALGLGPEVSALGVVDAYVATFGSPPEPAPAPPAPLDPWAMALDALFHAPGSSAAVFSKLGDEAKSIRVIRRGPDRMTRYGDTQILPATHVFDVRMSEAANPAIGDLIDIGSVSYAISLDPILDVEGLTWTCGAEDAS